MKKSVILALTAAVAAAVFFPSCQKNGENEISTTSVTVNVAMPDGFKEDVQYSGNEVVLKDRNSSRSYAASASNGVAVFSGVPYGVYDASTSCTLTNTEFKNAAKEEITGSITSDISLNGFVSSIQVTADLKEPVEMKLVWSVSSSLLISKIYNFGTLNLAGKAYSLDKYVEIFNNSDEVQYADGLWIANAYGSAIGSISTVYPEVETANEVYLERVVKLPGNGTDYPIEPGKSIVIAQNAKNHIDPEVITNTVDLSGADFECYVEGAPAMFFPSDNADVPNIIEKYGATSATAKFFAGTGTILVIFRMSDEDFETLDTQMGAGFTGTLQQYAPYCKLLPASKVIDAVDLYRKGYESRRGKHLPLSVDASYAACNQRCITERKISFITPDGRRVLQDTNNSAADFVLIEPVDNEAGEMVTPANLTPRDYTKPEIQPAE